MAGDRKDKDNEIIGDFDPMLQDFMFADPAGHDPMIDAINDKPKRGMLRRFINAIIGTLGGGTETNSREWDTYTDGNDMNECDSSGGSTCGSSSSSDEPGDELGD
ncbi:MAG TPA: hypothetical protein DEP72_02245 [Clostridiales bacterium]|nr:MAG: hypothetical protein A2Y18_00435 [Clostridiales bacterium GWD2_32_19]HCC06977.1 hypothetical protein [Clostridiales bacterium]